MCFKKNLLFFPFFFLYKMKYNTPQIDERKPDWAVYFRIAKKTPDSTCRFLNFLAWTSLGLDFQN